MFKNYPPRDLGWEWSREAPICCGGSEHKTSIVRSPYLLRQGGRLRTNTIQYNTKAGGATSNQFNSIQFNSGFELAPSRALLVAMSATATILVERRGGVWRLVCVCARQQRQSQVKSQVK